MLTLSICPSSVLFCAYSFPSALHSPFLSISSFPQVIMGGLFFISPTLILLKFSMLFQHLKWLYLHGYLDTADLANCIPHIVPNAAFQLSLKSGHLSHNSLLTICEIQPLHTVLSNFCQFFTAIFVSSNFSCHAQQLTMDFSA